MENFFAGSKYALYFIGLFFIIIQNRSNRTEKTNKNIILIYIIYALTNLFNIIHIIPNTIIVFSIFFIETQVLTLNEAESILLIKTRYKIVDYIFTMINKYKAVQMIILNICFSIIPKTYQYSFIATFMIGGVKKITFFSLFSTIYRCSIIVNVIIGVIAAVKFLSCISKIYLNEFRVKRLDVVEEEFKKLSEGFYLSRNCEDLDKKIQMLMKIEDRTFFARANSYISISFEALIYKINQSNRQAQKANEVKMMTIEKKIQYIIDNLPKVIGLALKIFKTVVKAIFLEDGVKRFIKRGYSTIEMQLMRQMSIEIGYEKVYRRKIYELLYTHMFFKSLDQKRRYNHYTEHAQTFKKRIAYVYFKKVPTFLNVDGMYKRCNNIYEFYKTVRTSEEIDEAELEPTKIVYALTTEEMFIFILGLSGKYLGGDFQSRYGVYIEKYSLNIDKIKEIISRI